MLLKRRGPRIDDPPPDPRRGFEHLDRSALAVLRWLASNRVQFVLVGPVAESVRGLASARGPVAIVPAPHRRNLARLAQALGDAHASVRVDGEGAARQVSAPPAKLTAEKLACGRLWRVRCGGHDLDIEGRVPGVATYQELLYETTRFELSEGLSVEVASPEDIEQYAHLRRTGVPPELRISRQTTVADGVEQAQAAPDASVAGRTATPEAARPGPST